MKKQQLDELSKDLLHLGFKLEISTFIDNFNDRNIVSFHLENENGKVFFSGTDKTDFKEVEEVAHYYSQGFLDAKLKKE